MQPLQQRIEVCFQQMKSHVEAKYGRRDVDPQLEKQLAQLARNQQQRQSGNGPSNPGSTVDGGSGGAIHHRLSNDVTHGDAMSPGLITGSSSRLSALSNSQSQAALSSAVSSRQTSGVSLFSRTSSQALSSLSFGLPTSPSSGPSMSPVKMLTSATGNRFRGGGVTKNNEKKLRDKENKQQRDSFRRLSSSSIGRGSPFPTLSLAGFGVGPSSSGPSSPAVTASNTPVLGESNVYFDVPHCKREIKLFSQARVNQRSCFPPLGQQAVSQEANPCRKGRYFNVVYGVSGELFHP